MALTDDYQVYKKLIESGIDPYHLATFLQSSIEQTRLLQSLHTGNEIDWLRKELELTEAEQLLVIIRKHLFHSNQ